MHVRRPYLNEALLSSKKLIYHNLRKFKDKMKVTIGAKLVAIFLDAIVDDVIIIM